MGKLSQYWRLSTTTVIALMFGVFACTAVLAQQEGQRGSAADVTELEVESPTSPVEIDGKVLFLVGGVSAYPADQRAAAIAG